MPNDPICSFSIGARHMVSLCTSIVDLFLSIYVGNIVHFSVFGSSMMVVNKFAIAIDLLEKRGAIYSDRPNMVLETEM
jgi:type III secretory pathway component EscV